MMLLLSVSTLCNLNKNLKQRRKHPQMWWLHHYKLLIKASCRAFLNSNLMRSIKNSNITNATLREVWGWHLRSKIRKISGKIGLKFWKLTFLCVNIQAFYNFFKIQAEQQILKKINLEKVYFKVFFISTFSKI